MNPRQLSRQQRRALERQAAKLQKRLDSAMTLRQMHTYWQNQRLHRRLRRTGRAWWARFCAYLNRPVF